MFNLSKDKSGESNMFLRSENITVMVCSSSSEPIRLSRDVLLQIIKITKFANYKICWI